jgi:tetratricopeptide (TPR) repeat protein
MKQHNGNLLVRRNAAGTPFAIVPLALLLTVTQFACSGVAATVNRQGDQVSQIGGLILEGQTNYTHGRYKEAVQLFEQARDLGTESPYQKAQLSLGLADSYRALGKYKEAEELFKKAIDEAEEEDAKNLNKKAKANAKHSSDLVPYMLSDLSVLYLDQSRFPECEQVTKDSIDLAIKKVGPKDINIALPLNGLTRLYLKWGKLSEAKNVNDRTLQLFSTPQAKNNWLYAYTAFNLAQLLNERGDYTKAEQLYKATLLGVESLFGFDHVYCAIILEPLGDMYRKESRYAEATKAFQRVREIRSAASSKDHPDYGKALLNLALVYRDEGRYARAQNLCQQATTVIEHALGQNNIEIAKCWITNASIFCYQGRYPEAEDLARRALQLDQKLLGTDHPTVAHDMVELAIILSDEGKASEAEDLLNKSLKISKDKLGPEHPDIVATIHSLAGIYCGQKDYVKAEKMYRDSLELAKHSLGTNNTQVLGDLRDLSGLLILQEKYGDAQPLLQQALEIDEKLFGKNSPQMARDLQSLANLCTKQNNSSLAASLLTQSAQITSSLPGASATQKDAAANLASNAARDRAVTDKWAIVIGISNFKDPSINLKYAAKDATDFRNVLISQENFLPDHVLLLTDANATREKIISNLGDGWLGRLAKKDDLVVAYVSSHGSASQEEVGVNFLVAEDTDKNKLVSTGIPLQWFTKIIQEQVHSNRVVVILDVCHSGSAVDESGDKSGAEDTDSQSDDSGGKGLYRTAGLDVGALNLGSGQVVLCSSLADQVSWESKHYQNSVFTRRLIESLQCKGKDTTLREAYEQLRASVGAEVLSERGAVQTPNLSNKNWSGGDPVLACPAAAPRSVQK